MSRRTRPAAPGPAPAGDGTTPVPGTGATDPAVGTPTDPTPPSPDAPTAAPTEQMVGPGAAAGRRAAPDGGTAADPRAASGTGTVAAGGAGRAASTVPVAEVRLAASGPRHTLRAVKVVWRREMIRFARDRGRLIAGLAQPLLLLFVLGNGLSGLVRAGTGGVDFTTFLFPGIVATSTLFTAIFAGVSIVWDREFGFLREMLVAPVPRTAILIGKCLGGATVATGQGVVMLALAGLVGVPYAPTMIVAMVGLLFLTAMTITAFGLMMSARIRTFQGVMPLVQLVLTPMMFLSGSLFPLSGLPAWLTVLTRLNPLTYAVEPMRHVVFAHLDLDEASRRVLDPGITWGSWLVPVWLQVLLVAVLGSVMLGLAAARFRRTD